MLEDAAQRARVAAQPLRVAGQPDYDVRLTRHFSPAVARCRTRFLRADRIGIVIGTSTMRDWSGGKRRLRICVNTGSFPVDYEYTEQEA